MAVIDLIDMCIYMFAPQYQDDDYNPSVTEAILAGMISIILSLILWWIW